MALFFTVSYVAIARTISIINVEVHLGGNVFSGVNYERLNNYHCTPH